MLKLMVLVSLGLSVAHALPDDEQPKRDTSKNNVHFLACEKKLRSPEPNIGFINQTVSFRFSDGSRATLALGPYIKSSGQAVEHRTFLQSAHPEQIFDVDVIEGPDLIRHVFERYSFSDDRREIRLYGDTSNPISELIITLNHPYDPGQLNPYLYFENICLYIGPPDLKRICALPELRENYIDLSRRVPSLLFSLHFEGTQASEILNALPFQLLLQSTTGLRYRRLQFSRYENGLVTAEADGLTPAEYLFLTDALRHLGLRKTHPIFTVQSKRL